MHPLISVAKKTLDSLCSYPCDLSLGLPTRGRELRAVTREKTRLDGDMVATAYSIVMDSRYLDMAAVCFTGISLGDTVVCFDKIRTQDARHSEGQRCYPSRMWSGVVVGLLCCRWPSPVPHPIGGPPPLVIKQTEEGNSLPIRIRS